MSKWEMNSSKEREKLDRRRKYRRTKNSDVQDDCGSNKLILKCRIGFIFDVELRVKMAFLSHSIRQFPNIDSGKMLEKKREKRNNVNGVFVLIDGILSCNAKGSVWVLGEIRLLRFLRNCKLNVRKPSCGFLETHPQIVTLRAMFKGLNTFSPNFSFNIKVKFLR